MKRLFITFLSLCILSLFSVGSVYSMDVNGDLDVSGEVTVVGDSTLPTITMDGFTTGQKNVTARMRDNNQCRF